MAKCPLCSDHIEVCGMCEGQLCVSCGWHKGPTHYMSIEEFWSEGYLQELNRQFLHPLGLALSIKKEGDEWKLDGVWDYRNDPEGMTYGEDVISREKKRRIENLWSEKAVHRLDNLGYIVQPY